VRQMLAVLAALAVSVGCGNSAVGDNPASTATAAAPAETVRRGKAALALTASAAYAFALEPLGFVLTTFLLLLFLLVAIEARRWPSSLMIATATSLGSHLLFKVWLAVPLPAGPWGF